MSIIVNRYWPPLDKYAVISEVTFDKLQLFSERILRNLYIKGLIQGNVPKDVAIATTNSIVSKLSYQRLLPNTYPQVGQLFFNLF